MSMTSNLRRRTGIILTTMVLLAIASLLFAGMTGSVAIPLSDLPSALNDLLHGRSTTLAATLLELRAGRALTAFVTGAALSLAGVMMQALLRNPLADPYVLSISTGASVGALAALMLLSAAWIVDASAFTGAIIISMTLYLLARRDLREIGR